MTRILRHILNGFGSLGNFFGDSRPLLPHAPRSVGAAWSRDWQKIGGDFKRVLDGRGVVIANNSAQLNEFGSNYEGSKIKKYIVRLIQKRREILRVLLLLSVLLMFFASLFIVSTAYLIEIGMLSVYSHFFNDHSFTFLFVFSAFINGLCHIILYFYSRQRLKEKEKEVISLKSLLQK
ncbi:MAG: hypothetical protein QM537_03380 [Candidatus Symbiobacter sp.]|nr:hypothetical protein [Candidatus Symbiobacter sp.]